MPSALDEGAALPVSRLAGDGGECGEAGSTRPDAQFRQVDDQSCGCDVRDPWGGGQDLGPALQRLLLPEPTPANRPALGMGLERMVRFPMTAKRIACPVSLEPAVQAVREEALKQGEHASAKTGQEP